MELVNRPVNLVNAQSFIEKHHRHSEPLKRHMWTIGAKTLGDWAGLQRWHLMGIATVDRCSSAWSKRRDRLEIRRLCVTEDAPANTCSFLLGHTKRAAWALGYEALVTYTQPHESGSSLKGAGFMITKRAAMYENADGTVTGGLIRWEAKCGHAPDGEDRKFTDDILKDLRHLTVDV